MHSRTTQTKHETQAVQRKESKRKEEEKVESIKMISIACIIVIVLSCVSTSPLPSHVSPLCSHHFTEDIPLESSRWKVLLESGRFSPVADRTDHHMKRLRHKLAELIAIIDFYMEKYAQVGFRDSFCQLGKEMKDFH